MLRVIPANMKFNKDFQWLQKLNSNFVRVPRGQVCVCMFKDVRKALASRRCILCFYYICEIGLKLQELRRGGGDQSFAASLYSSALVKQRTLSLTTSAA